MPFNTRHLVLAFLLINIAPVSAQKLDAKSDKSLTKPESRFHLYYGNDAGELAKIESSLVDGSIVVIDTRAFTEEGLTRWSDSVHRKSGRVIGYFSIGELHSNEVSRFKAVLLPTENWEDLIIDENEVFRSFRVDVKHEAWKRWVAQEVKALLDLGIDGIFLDTVDTIDRYATREEWSLSRRAESVAAMINLIQSIKRDHPESYLMQNGGLNMIGKKMFIGSDKGIETEGQNLALEKSIHPDGLLWENAFVGKDEWTLGRQRIIGEIHQAGFTKVFALGYREAHPEASGFFEQCSRMNLIGSWAPSSLVLHETATVSDTSP